MAEMTESKNFIHAFIDEDIAPGGQFAGQTVHTRFPPEPNGYLHIGHCKALIIDFGTAEKYNGLCNLRMDDTNPTKEDVEFVEAIKEDIHWLGFDWGDRFYYGSDYFEKDYEYAVELIKKGLAYVCELTPEQFKEYRGDLTYPCRFPLPRPPHRGKSGPVPPECGPANSRTTAIPSGPRSIWPPATSICATRSSTASAICTTTVRETSGASIPCTTLPTPFRTRWRALPTPCALWNSRTTVLFTTGWWSTVDRASSSPADRVRPTGHRPHRAQQAQAASSWWRTAMSPAGTTPGCPPSAACAAGAIPPSPSATSASASAWPSLPNTVDYAFLEHCLREDLNETAQRVMAVLRPVKLTITNYPAGQDPRRSPWKTIPNRPEDGTREVTFSRHLWIEAGRLPGRADPQVQAPVPQRAGVPPEGRVPHHLHRLRQG